MRRHSTIVAALATAGTLLCSCTGELQNPVEKKLTDQVIEVKGTVLCAVQDVILGTDETKTSLLNGDVYWESGDQIMMISVNDKTKRYTLSLDSSSDGSRSGSFSTDQIISESEYPFIVLYPASAFDATQTSVTISETDCFCVNLPETQTYRPGSPAQGTIITCGYIATSEGLSQVSMKNLGSLVRLTLKGSATIKEVKLTANDGFLAGSSLAVPSSFGADQTLLGGNGFTPQNTDTADNITLDCGEGATLSADGTDFYFFVPAKQLGTGFNVDILTVDDFRMQKSAPALTQNTTVLSKMTNMPSFKFVKKTPVIAGIFNKSSDSGDLAKVVKYEGVWSQCGYELIDNEHCRYRFMDWTAGYEVTLTVNPEPVVNSEYTITISACGNVPTGLTTGDITATCKSVTDESIYFVDSNGNGYLINK